MNERLSAIVGARISEFRRKMAEVNNTMRRTASNVVVNVNARVDKAQSRLDRIAKTINSIQTVAGNAMQGSLVAISPSAIPAIASLVGGLAALGPMIGTVAGSTFALATAFGFAGSAAVAFGAVAIPTISKLFDEEAKLTAQQKAARGEFDKFKSTWQGIVEDLEKPVLQAFSKAMQAANKVLQMARPLFDGAAKAANNLLSSLNASLDSAPVKAFFDYMNKQGGPMLERLGKAAGNFMKGFMSMMTAFGPLAEQTAQGFLEMSKGFADWSAGLGKSKKFQEFVTYIQENMPKIKSIVGDAIVGIINTFSAFGPLSSDMMSALQRIMGKFKEWSASLSENQGFQKFISYIRTNGPKVVSLIGQIGKFLVNLGVAMAPIGAWLLDVITKFASWTNKMMEAHPWLGKLIGISIMVGGALQALVPIITMVVTTFSGFGTTLAGIAAKVGLKLLPFLTKIGTFIVSLGKKFLANAARIASSWLIAMGPIGWVTAAVAGLVILVIANWEKVKEWTMKIWSAVSKFISDSATKILGYIKEKFPALYKVIQSYMKMAQDIISTVWNFVKGTFKNVLSFLKSLVKGDFQGMKDAISNQMELSKKTISKIWNSIKSFFGSVLSQIWSKVKQKFADIVRSVAQKMTEALSKVKEIGGNIVDFFGNIDLYESGKAIIQSAIDGISAMKNKILGKVENIVGAVRDFWPFSPAKRGPLSDIHRMDFAGPIGTSIGKAKSGVMRSMSGLASVAMSAFKPQRPQLTFGVALSPATDFGNIRRTSVNTTSLSGVAPSSRTKEASRRNPQPNNINIEAAPIYLDERILGEVVFRVTEELQAQKEAKITRFGGEPLA
jgi:phage-related protein